MFITNPFPGAFGLDIGDASLKLVQLQRHSPLGREPYFTLSEMRTVALSPGLIVNGEIQQPEIIRKKIINLIGQEGRLKSLKSPWVVVDLPEPQTFLKLIDIDGSPDTLISEDVFFQARKHLPFELETAYVDWQIINPSQGNAAKSQVLVGAVPKLIADSYTYLLEAAGLNPLALEIEAMAITRAMITHNKNYAGMARAILDVGANRSSLIIFDNNSIQFSTSLKFSGNAVTAAIAEQLHLDPEQAEKLKIQNGLVHDRTHPDYLKIVAAAVDGLIEEIKKTLFFYRERFLNANPVTHITLCGGMASFKNMDAVIARQLNTAAHPGTTMKNVVVPDRKKKKPNENLNMVSAIGLALRAAANPLQVFQKNNSL